MWTALFIITVAAAVCFSIASIVLQQGSQKGLPTRKSRWSTMAGFARDWSGISFSDATRRSDARFPHLTIQGSQNADLLLRRMKSLDLDADELARSEPLLFRQLESRCRSCEGQEQCERDLARKSIDQPCYEWRDYCPNGAMLNMLNVVQGCAFDLRQLR